MNARRRAGADRRSVVDGLGPDPDAVIEQLAAWSDRCVAAGAFPHNPHKRAAG